MALKIRKAVPDEKELVIEMIAAMCAESPFYSRKPLSLERVDRLVSFFIDDAESGGFVADESGKLVGMIAGMVAPSMTHDLLFAADIGVYVDPDRRGSSVAVRLIKVFEEWAFGQGVDFISLGISTGVQPEKTLKVYERLGYKLSSFGAIKERDCHV